MFIIKTDTPEATRDEIVKWLNLMASNHRIAAAKLNGMHKRELELARATTYQGAADFLGNAKVEGSTLSPHEEKGDDWKEDPSADERWQAGCDFALLQLCACLTVDPKSITWDAATDTLDGDVCSVIYNIMDAKMGDKRADGGS